VLDIRAIMSAYPGLTLSAIIAIVGARAYLLFGRWQRSTRRLAAAEERAARARKTEGSQTTIESSSALQRAARGSAITAIFPGVFSIPLLLIGVFGGRYQLGLGGTTDYFELALLYFLGAVLLGAIIGYGMPLTRNAFVRVLVGMLAVAPWLIGIAYAGDSNHLNGFDAVFVAGMTVVLGIALAYGARRGDRWRLVARGQ